jgi:hypothetical protein
MLAFINAAQAQGYVTQPGRPPVYAIPRGDSRFRDIESPSEGAASSMPAATRRPGRREIDAVADDIAAIDRQRTRLGLPARPNRRSSEQCRATRADMAEPDCTEVVRAMSRF